MPVFDFSQKRGNITLQKFVHHLAHIVNPFIAPESSDLAKAQPVTFQSMIHAKKKAGEKVNVELLAAVFEEDLPVVPEGFRVTKFLKQSVLDFGTFNQPVKLPLIGDILERLYTETKAEYLIYTNVDIGLYPDFYLKVNEFIEAGNDAFVINRRRLSAGYLFNPNLDLIYMDKGKKHPGFDCFVFHRSLFPKMKLGHVCIGVPFIEITLSQNLFALGNNFKLFEDELLSFHLGMEIYRKRWPREYFRFNRRAFHKVENELFPFMTLQRFPYPEQKWIVRLIKWVFHPCIPTRLVFKLAILNAFKSFSKNN